MKNTLMAVNRFLVRAKTNPMLILTVSGEFVPESLCGPGGYCAKLYKSRRGAENAGSNVTVHPCTEYGVEEPTLIRLGLLSSDNAMNTAD
jgi:hypothetical protein